jgi:hypothetical protein
MRPAVTKSNVGLPGTVAGETVFKFDAVTRFGHHGFHRFTPGEIMLGFLVPSRSFRIPIGFHQHESGWVVLLLDDVESSYAGFLNTVARIFQCGCFKCFHLVFFDVNKYVNDSHDAFIES